MYGNDGHESGPRPDRRVQRTREALLGAMIELVSEQGYDETTVQNVLDRANVGRSTFYAHFANKEDLLLGRWKLFQLEPGSAGELPDTTHVFQHVREQRAMVESLERSQMLGTVLQLAREDLEESFERALALRIQHGADLPDEPAFLARFLAGAYLSLLMNWLRGGMGESPVEMDERFRNVADRLARP